MEILIGCVFGIIIFLTFYADLLIKTKIARIVRYLISLILILIFIFINKFEMDAEFWTFLAGLIALFADRYYTNRKNKKLYTNREKYISKKILDVDDKLVGIKKDLVSLKSDIDFRNVLRNQLRDKTSQFVDINSTMKPEFKTIIMGIGQLAEDLALKFYYCEHRDDPDEMEKFLNSTIAFEKAKMKNLMNSYIMELRAYGKPPKRIRFSAFIEEKDVNGYMRLDLLKIRLIENGLNTEAVIKDFKKFLEQFLHDFMKLVIIWKRLPHE